MTPADACGGYKQHPRWAGEIHIFTHSSGLGEGCNLQKKSILVHLSY